ncbi:MAG: hypothetical protein ACRC6T_02720 [Sarcina sp.]
MSLLKRIKNARYTIMTIMVLVSSRMCMVSTNKFLNSSTNMLLLLSMCLVGFAVRHNNLIEKPRKKKTKWIEVF